MPHTNTRNVLTPEAKAVGYTIKFYFYVKSYRELLLKATCRKILEVLESNIPHNTPLPPKAGVYLRKENTM